MAPKSIAIHHRHIHIKQDSLLGLAITQKAIHLSHGKIQVQNSPGIGCMFILDIPQKLGIQPSNKQTVKGINSVQPNFNKKPLS